MVQSLENSMRATLLVLERQIWRRSSLTIYRIKATKLCQDLESMRRIQLSAKRVFTTLLQLGSQLKDKCSIRVRNCQDLAFITTLMLLETTKNNQTLLLKVNTASAKPKTDGKHLQRRSQLPRQMYTNPWIIWTKTTTLPSKEVDKPLSAEAPTASSISTSTSRSSRLVQELTIDSVTSPEPTE